MQRSNGASAAVVIANRGERASVSYAKYGRRTRVQVSGGEYYRVSCPLCRDTKQHLWVSYLYGTRDRRTGQVIAHVAVCYRCNLEGPGSEYVRDMLMPLFGQASVISGLPCDQLIEPAPLQAMNAPDGCFVNIANLPTDHAATLYLERRGVSRQEQGRTCGWLYCQESPNEYVSQRLLIPLWHEERGHLLLAGYQTRAIDGHSTIDQPKYWTAPGTPKSRIVYNLHNARRLPVIVITEGVFDAARVGMSGVALLGKSMSTAQARLICSQAARAKVLVMLDADAHRGGHRAHEDSFRPGSAGVDSYAYRR